MPTPIRIDYYTDPLCSWCFATEPMLDRVKGHFQNRIEIHYKMFPLFGHVREVMNAPSRLWTIADRYRIVSKKAGVYINNKVWYTARPSRPGPPARRSRRRNGKGSKRPVATSSFSGNRLC